MGHTTTEFWVSTLARLVVAVAIALWVWERVRGRARNGRWRWPARDREAREPDRGRVAPGKPRTLTRRIWIPQLVAALLLLWALNPGNPYGYYILLRWVCCAIFAYLAFRAFEDGRDGWVWVLGITAAVYNPIFRVHLTREIWSLVNIVTIGIALASVFALKRRA